MFGATGATLLGSALFFGTPADAGFAALRGTVQTPRSVSCGVTCKIPVLLRLPSVTVVRVDVVGRRAVRRGRVGNHAVRWILRVTPGRSGTVVLRIRIAGYRVLTRRVRLIRGQGRTHHASRTFTGVSAGTVASCALESSGQVFCWGVGTDGELGDGAMRNSSTPVRVAGIDDAIQLASGAAHTCALRRVGTVVCWGHNFFGQLGDGTTVNRGAPVPVVGLTNVVQLSANFANTCAVLGDGTVRCWGRSDTGSLGDGTPPADSLASIPHPVAVTGLQDASEVSVGGTHVCALRRTGTVACWGDNRWNQLGNGSTDPASLPTEVPNVGDATDIASSQVRTCVVLSAGAVICWGDNDKGQLGTGVPSKSAGPATVQGLTAGETLTGGINDAMCARQRGATTPVCWGENDFGQLGSIVSATLTQPLTVPLDGVDQVSLGRQHSCAIAALKIYCWGENADGELGDGTTTSRVTPRLVTIN